MRCAACTLDERAISERRAKLTASHDALMEKRRAQQTAARKKTPIDPVWLCAALSDTLPDDTIYIDEVTTHTGLLREHIRWNKPQSLFTRQGGLGQGLGLSLGVKLAKPDRPVVTLIGDGAFLYNPVLQSFGASRDFNLPILVVIFNNKKYAAMQNMHKRMYPEGAAVETGQLSRHPHQWSGLREGDRSVRRLRRASRGSGGIAGRTEARAGGGSCGQDSRA